VVYKACAIYSPITLQAYLVLLASKEFRVAMVGREIKGNKGNMNWHPNSVYDTNLPMS